MGAASCRPASGQCTRNCSLVGTDAGGDESEAWQYHNNVTENEFSGIAGSSHPQPSAASNKSSPPDTVRLPSESLEWLVEVDRSSGDPLGLQLDSGRFIVESVKCPSLIATWNMDCADPSKRVKEGDVVVAVNGMSNAMGIISESRKQQHLKIKVSRAKVAESSQSAPTDWEVQLDRSSGEQLGLQLNSATMEVESVKWQSLVGTWNIECPDSQRIRTGDRILEVNGLHKPEDMIAECKKSKKLRLIVTRTRKSPRK